MITTLTTRTVMEHLWKATREKLLSGKNNFRNENDLLLPICITFFFLLCGHRENDKEGKKNHFIIMLLLFSRSVFVPPRCFAI